MSKHVDPGALLVPVAPAGVPSFLLLSSFPRILLLMSVMDCFGFSLMLIVHLLWKKQCWTMQVSSVSRAGCTDHGSTGTWRSPRAGRSKTEDWHVILTLGRDVQCMLQRCTQ